MADWRHNEDELQEGGSFSDIVRTGEINMGHSIHRREFLAKCGLAVGSLALDRNSISANPGEASGKQPRLFTGCCAYSYKKYLDSGQMGMEDFILKAVELGIDGVDITTYWLKSTEPAYLAALRHFAYKNGMPFSGAAIGTNMCQPDPQKRTEELANIKRWVDRTELLGASHLRVFGGAPPPGATDEDGIQWVTEVMKSAADYSAQKGVIIGIESHGGITSKAANIIEILRRVDSPYARCNLDISHFHQDPYTQIEACIPYASHTHIRDSYGEKREPLDLDRIGKMFADGGYRGYMSAEYEGEEDPVTGVPKLIGKIKALCKKYSTV